ncbi:MAG: hypothetical protein FJ295_02320 [Planctomycetes bacterium]|nr:hypothetical protein [Planctomycetota bacterium]
MSRTSTCCISSTTKGPTTTARRIKDFPQNVGTRAIKDHITSWEHEYEFPSGKWAQTDYNFETPSTSLLAQTDSVIALPDIKKYEVFDFPDEYEKKSEGDAENMPPYGLPGSKTISGIKSKTYKGSGYNEIVLQTGQASITMKKYGDIVIKG